MRVASVVSLAVWEYIVLTISYTWEETIESVMVRIRASQAVGLVSHLAILEDRVSGRLR
jgi:hypothetical protein